MLRVLMVDEGSDGKWSVVTDFYIEPDTVLDDLGHWAHHETLKNFPDIVDDFEKKEDIESNDRPVNLDKMKRSSPERLMYRMIARAVDKESLAHINDAGFEMQKKYRPVRGLQSPGPNNQTKERADEKLIVEMKARVIPDFVKKIQ